MYLTQSREGSSIADDWDERPHTVEEVKAMLQHRKEVAMKREKKLSQAFSQQVLLLILFTLKSSVLHCFPLFLFLFQLFHVLTS